MVAGAAAVINTLGVIVVGASVCIFAALMVWLWCDDDGDDDDEGGDA